MGYNLTSGGENKIFSKTSIKKMSESHKGYTPTLIQRQRISNSLKNRTISAEHRRKLSIANRKRIEYLVNALIEVSTDFQALLIDEVTEKNAKDAYSLYANFLRINNELGVMNL